MEGLAFAHHARFEHDALAIAGLALDGQLQDRIKVVEGNAGEKAQAAEIHREDGDVAFAEQARRGQQRAVAAEHDEQIGKGRNFLTGLYLARGWGAFGGLAIAESVYAPLL